MTYSTPTFCPSCHGRTDRGFDGPSCPGHPTDSDLATSEQTRQRVLADLRRKTGLPAEILQLVDHVGRGLAS